MHHPYPAGRRRHVARMLLLALLLGISPLAGATTSTAAEPLEPLTLQLRWHHQFQFAGYYAAKHLGYYRDIGLDVTIRAGAPGREPVNEVLGGRAQYGVANSELLHQRLLGQPLVALAAIFQHSASVFVAKQSSGIRTPQDLIGRRVMLISQGADVGLMAMLHNEGVDPSRVELIKSSYDVNDLVEDRVDAFNSYLTNEPYLLAEKHIPISVIHPATYGVDFYSDILFTTEQELRAHPERVKRFREASLRGWQYAMDHPEEIVDLILRDYNPGKSRDHLLFEAASMRALIMPNLIEYGHMNPGRWRHMADTFVRQGMASAGYNLDGFIYDPNPEPDLSGWHNTVLALLAAILLIVGVTLVLTYYNQKLRSAIRYGNQVQRRLQKQTALFEAIFRSSPDATVITNPQQEIILCNPAFSQIFGYRPDDVIGKPMALFHESEAGFEAQRRLRFHLGAQPSQEPYEIHYRRKSGEVFPSQSTGGPIIDFDGDTLGFIVVMRDITEQKKSEQEIIRMALTDPLTGLANRHQFNLRIRDTVKLARRQGRLLSLAMMDLDYFKQVNDRYGHPTGDALLKQVAEVLRGAFRETDIIARIGGDEFAVIMIDPDDRTAIRQPAERVIRALSAPLEIDGASILIGASFGVATFPVDARQPTELYRLADQALYESKQAGRNRCSLAGSLESA